VYLLIKYSIFRSVKIDFFVSEFFKTLKLYIAMNKKIVIFFSASLMLSGCAQYSYMTQDRISERTLALMAGKNMSPRDPVLIRIYKKESELEVWKARSNGTYALLKTYPICRWSGQLGPKTREGDRQAPEGFYTVTPAMMNPNSRHFRSFNLGYPNEYDRAHGYTGSYLMVHGGCSSRGCYSMTDGQMSEIYALMRESFTAGQRGIQVQALPFRMTHRNLALYRADARMPFWRMLKQGSDIFEITQTEPKVSFCGRRYVFNAIPSSPGTRFSVHQPCPAFQTAPALAQALMNKDHNDETQIHALVSKGVPATQRLYEDGDQHAVFRKSLGMHVSDVDTRSNVSTREVATPALSMVSRPETLARGPQEIVVATSNYDYEHPMLTPRSFYLRSQSQAVISPPAAPSKNLTANGKKPKLQFQRTVPGRRATVRAITRQPTSPTALQLRETLRAQFDLRGSN